MWYLFNSTTIKMYVVVLIHVFVFFEELEEKDCENPSLRIDFYFFIS